MPNLHRSRRDQGAGAGKRRTRQQRANNAVRANREELSATRRADVYTNTAHGEEQPPRGMPPRGADRDALVEQIRALKAAGATHLAVAVELDLHTWDVSKICREHGIPSARKAQGGHRG